MRVLVIEPDDEADCHLAVLQVIEERSAIGAAIHWPADRVGDLALAMLGWIDLPQFLDADAEGLRIAAFAQLELLEQGLGERAAAAFREQRLLAVQFDTAGVVGG